MFATGGDQVHDRAVLQDLCATVLGAADATVCVWGCRSAPHCPADPPHPPRPSWQRTQTVHTHVCTVQYSGLYNTLPSHYVDAPCIVQYYILYFPCFPSNSLEVTNLGLTLGKQVRQDVNFWKKCGNDILLSVQENFELPNNSLANIEALYVTLMLLLAEIRSDDVIVDILRVLLHIQVG